MKHITKQAILEIKEFEKRSYDKNLIPSLIWQRILPDGDWHLGIGFSERKNIPANCVISTNNTAVAVGAPETILQNLEYGKIDYRDGSFILL
ncbi:MAG: hypothetical protein AAFQ37_06890 [Bacteroidota bacterium]